ncbi:MAG: ABC transporter permease [Gemmobacter sp.]|nr:ABC transporter permease [Gemmobacter sp.]
MSRTVFALMLREMATTYGRSPGGYLWAILEPAAALALLSVIFSLAFRSPGLGVNFPLFFATGYLPFAMFTGMSNKMASSIKFSRPLLAYPSVTYLDALLARFLLVLLTDLTIAYVFFTGILFVYDTRTILSVPPVLLGFAMIAVLGAGVGVLNCYLFMAFPAWERAWHILTRPLFIISCVLFVFDEMPEIAQDVLWWNPIIHSIGAVRRGFYATYEAPYVSVPYTFAVGLGILLVGLLLLRRHHRALIND